MSKVITSPIKRFPGTVTIPDYLTIPQAQAWEQSLRSAEALKGGHSIADVEYIQAWEPGIRAVVGEWALGGFTPDPFQTTPRGAVIGLIAWLIGEVTALYWEAESVPNE